MRNFWTYVAYATALFPGAYLVIRFADNLNTVDKVVSVVLPVLIGWAFYFITDQSNKKLLQEKIDQLTRHFDKSVESIVSSKGIVYASKKSVPGQAIYWNNLSFEAQKVLFIVGTTNKSWFNKGEIQSKRLAQEFARIKNNGGSVVIVALKSSGAESFMREFAQRFCNDGRGRFLNSFKFGIVDKLNYGVVLNDERIVIMPIPHDEQFREESMVIEIAQRDSVEVYNNYKADIERIAAKASLINL